MLDFNKLVFSSPLAHFPEGQKLLMKIVAEGVAPSDQNVRGAYAEAASDINADLTKLRKRQIPNHPGSFELSRTDKISLLRAGEPASWFKPGAQSAAEATKMMCNMNRVYKIRRVGGKRRTYDRHLRFRCRRLSDQSRVRGKACRIRGESAGREHDARNDEHAQLGFRLSERDQQRRRSVRQSPRKGGTERKSVQHRSEG